MPDNSTLSVFPVLGNAQPPSQFKLLDLSSSNQILQQTGLQQYLHQTLPPNTVGYGGYLENRDFYLDSTLFHEKKRTLHLGIDLWAPANTPIYAPLDGIIHSFQDNQQYLDYGPTILLQHTLPDGKSFYTLYGHLTQASLYNKIAGQRIKKGEHFAQIGHPDENGQWPPHLHLQWINDLEGFSGDYPGVVVPEDREKFEHNCPNPAALIGLS